MEFVLLSTSEVSVREVEERLNSRDKSCGEKDNTLHVWNGGKDEGRERPIGIEPNLNLDKVGS
jgi:hypothetical protein